MVIYKKGYKKKALECPECGCVFDATDDKDIHNMTYTQKICVKCPDCKYLMVANGVDSNEIYKEFGTYVPLDQEPCE